MLNSSSQPCPLSDLEELELIVQLRRKGEKIAYWSENGCNLVVLFDQKPAPRWSCYKVLLQLFNGPVIMENATIRGDSSDRVAGVFFPVGIQEVFSSYFLNNWKGEYASKVRDFNRQKVTLPLQSIWHHYVTIAIATWRTEPGYIKDNDPEWILEMYHETIDTALAEMEVHIPLIKHPDEVLYPH